MLPTLLYFCPRKLRTSERITVHHFLSIAYRISAQGHSMNVLLVTITRRLSGSCAFHALTVSQSAAVRLGPLAMQTAVCFAAALGGGFLSRILQRSALPGSPGQPWPQTSGLSRFGQAGHG